MGSIDEYMKREIETGVAPALPEDRVMRLPTLIWVQIGFGIATWTLVTGGWTTYYIPLLPAIGAIIAGNFGIMMWISLQSKAFARYGVDTFWLYKAVWGNRGSIGVMFWWIIMNFGWITVASYMAAESISAVTSAAALPGWTGNVMMWAIIIYGLSCWIFTYKGVRWISKFAWVASPLIIAIIIMIFFLLMTSRGAYSLAVAFAAKPLGSTGDLMADVMIAAEINIGVGFSWVPYFGQYARITKSETHQYTAATLGWGFIFAMIAILPAAMGILVGSYDPADWMFKGFGPIWGSVGLAFIILANITSIDCLCYVHSISIKTVMPRMKWWLACATTLFTIPLLVFPFAYYAFQFYSALIAGTFGPLFGVFLSDYFFIRREKVSVLELIKGKKSIYQYHKGFNLPAWIAFACGVAYYFSIYNPYTLTFLPIFRWTTASLPAFGITVAVHYVLSKFWYAKKMEGCTR